MSRFNAWFITFIALSMGVACNQGEFAGSGSKKESTASTKKDENRDDNTDKNDKSDVKDIGGPGTDGKGDPNDSSDDATGKPGTGGDSSINDVLNGLLGGDNDSAVTQPNDDEIIYGGTKVFHIGDSDMTNTSCQAGMSIFSLAGRRYYFEFEVKEADTTVTVNVNKICGVDYSDTNILAIAHGGAYTQEQKLVTGATSATIASNGPLAPGRYAVAIESRVGSVDAEESVRATDADDYIVGEVHIKASKPIKPGKVGAQ